MALPVMSKRGQDSEGASGFTVHMASFFPVPRDKQVEDTGRTDVSPDSIVVMLHKCLIWGPDTCDDTCDAACGDARLLDTLEVVTL
jgi:hypothetical protein